MSGRRTKKKRILFRLDASSRVGLGHLRRMMALAAVFKQRGSLPHFLVDDDGENLPVALPYPQMDSLGSDRWDMAVVDSYRVSPEEYEKIRSASGCCVVVADGKDPGFSCDAIIDHNLSASPAIYARRRKEGARLLIGLRYAMIRKEIVRARSLRGAVKEAIKPEIKNILLALGGTRQEDNYQRLLQYIVHCEPKAQVSVLIPSAALAGAIDRSKCQVVCAPKNVALYMQRADLAVCAAGVTSLVLTCIGVPMICVMLAENQAPGAMAVQKKRIGYNFGWPDQWSQEKFAFLYRAISNENVRKTMSTTARGLIDGLGPQRIVRVLESLLCRAN